MHGWTTSPLTTIGPNEQVARRRTDPSQLNSVFAALSLRRFLSFRFPRIHSSLSYARSVLYAKHLYPTPIPFFINLSPFLHPLTHTINAVDESIVTSDDSWSAFLKATNESLNSHFHNFTPNLNRSNSKFK